MAQSIYERILAEMNSKDKPRKAPSEEEHDIQCACVEWFRWQYPRLTKNLFAVPNGGGRSKSQAGKLKAEGVLAGVSDLILLVRRGGYGGLLIEMKTAKGKQSESQKEWQAHIEQYGYKYVVCHSLEEFQKVVNDYLKQEQI